MGTGIASRCGSVTERSSSSEKTRPKKCESIVLAEACHTVHSMSKEYFGSEKEFAKIVMGGYMLIRNNSEKM